MPLVVTSRGRESARPTPWPHARIEILTQEYDFAAGGTQEEHIVLTVDAPCRLDQALCPHFNGRALGIGKGVIPGVEEAEVFHRSEKPGDVAHHLSPSRQPRRMTERRRVRQFPYHVVGNQRLPLLGVSHERLEVPLQRSTAIVNTASFVASLSPNAAYQPRPKAVGCMPELYARLLRMYIGATSMTRLSDIVRCDPDVLEGTPVFAGTRVPIQSLFDFSKAARPWTSFCASSHP